MKVNVYLVSDAEYDLFEIYNYVVLNDSVDNAKKLIKKIEETCHRLVSFPERGYIPPELERINIFDFREIHYESYRLIYKIEKFAVYIFCVLDNRRSLQDLLEQRMLR